MDKPRKPGRPPGHHTPHRRGTRAAVDGEKSPPKRYLTCPGCGRLSDAGRFGTLHSLTVRIRTTAGYKQIEWGKAELLASERVALLRQLRRALAALKAEG